MGKGKTIDELFLSNDILSKSGNIFQRLFGKRKDHQLEMEDLKNNFLKVYSHPRSGTHFLEAFIGRNFYPGADLSIKPIAWGHWSDRRKKVEGNPYGKLFGSHYFPQRIEDYGKMVYIVRDPRAVAWSIWKTPNFLHEETRPSSFGEFLRRPLDWRGSPAKKSALKHTIFEHWLAHVTAWENFAEAYSDLIILRYEDLVDAPNWQFEKIRNTFFPEHRNESAKIDVVSDPVGLLPNKARKDAWKDHFTLEDLDFVTTLIPKKYQEKYFDE